MAIPQLSFLWVKARPTQTMIGPLRLDRGRVHEFCGPARHRLAAFVLHEIRGPVVWAHPDRQTERLFCGGFTTLADAARLILARAPREDEVLWAAERALRAGAAPLVVADLGRLPGLTAVRRLQLAAEAGADVARALDLPAPLGLLLTPQGGGAPGVESRWHLAPHHGPACTRWHLTRERARTDQRASWLITADAAGRPHLTRVDQPAQPPGPGRRPAPNNGLPTETS
jgi:protein ImuA